MQATHVYIYIYKLTMGVCIGLYMYTYTYEWIHSMQAFRFQFMFWAYVRAGSSAFCGLFLETSISDDTECECNLWNHLYSATRFSFSTLGLSLEQALPAQCPATWGEVALQQQLSRQQEQLEALQKQHLQHQRFGNIILSKFFTFWIFGDAAIADRGHWGHWGMTVSILRSLQAKCAFQACPGLSGGARVEVKTDRLTQGLWWFLSFTVLTVLRYKHALGY